MAYHKRCLVCHRDDYFYDINRVCADDSCQSTYEWELEQEEIRQKEKVESGIKIDLIIKCLSTIQERLDSVDQRIKILEEK